MHIKTATLLAIMTIALFACGKSHHGKKKNSTNDSTNRELAGGQSPFVTPETSGSKPQTPTTSATTPVTAQKSRADVMNELMTSFCTITLQRSIQSGSVELAAGGRYLLAKQGLEVWVYAPTGQRIPITSSDIASASCDYSKVKASEAVIGTSFSLYDNTDFSGEPICSYAAGEIVTGRDISVTSIFSVHEIHIDGMETKCLGMVAAYSKSFPEILLLIKLAP